MPAAATSPVRRKIAKSVPKTKTSTSKNPTPLAPASAETMAAEKSRLEKRTGISSAKLREFFELKEGESVEPVAGTPPTPIQKLRALIRDRVKDGKRISLKDWRVYHAIDIAYNAPFEQITPTLIGRLLSKSRRATRAEVEKELAALGLSEDTLFRTVVDPKDKTKKIKEINQETFTKVLVPIVKSVINARESKLYEDRNNNPFLLYSAQRQTEETKLVGDVITNIVEGITNGYGLKTVVRAAIHQALKYSFAIAFPAEIWHYETDVDMQGEEYTRKEGIRYNIPHPTRVFWDRAYRPATINTDTGCEFYGYWNLARFSDIESNPAYYNKDKVTFGECWAGPPYDYYFKEVYPCTMDFPVKVDEWINNRERDVQTYSSSDHDKAVWRTEIFMKLKPAQWGLGDYKHNLWFRFVTCNEGMVVYAEPAPYPPGLYAGSDADDNVASKCAGFGLEAIPWQDLVGNVLSQHLLSLRQNCIRVIPYDVTQVTPSMINDIAARSHDSVAIHWIPVNPREQRVGQQETRDIFQPLTFSQVDTGAIISTISQVLNIMERALGMSAQEVGSIAGHIQTAEEIRVVSQNTSSRLDYMGNFIDEFIDAMKRQIYVGFQHFGDADYVVNVAGTDAKKAELLKKKYGFKQVKQIERDVVEVSGDATKLSVDNFISSRESKTRLNQPQLAQIILQTIQAIAASPVGQRIAPEDIIKMYNRAAQMAGAPEDFEIKISPDATLAIEQQKVLEQIQQHAKQIADAATQQATAGATKTISQQVGPVLQKQGEELQQTTEVAGQSAEMGVELDKKIKQLEAVIAQLAQMTQMAAAAPPPPSQVMPVNGPDIGAPALGAPVMA